MDWRSMFEGRYLGSWNLIDADGNRRDVTVTIESVAAEMITGNGGRKAKKPVLRFVGKELPMVIGKTVGKTIAAMYGNDTAAWLGKRITIYPGTTEFGGETVDCIRVRPGIPPEPKEDRRASH